MICTQLQTLLEAGFPITKALEILAESPPRESVKQMALRMMRLTAGGVPIDNVLAEAREMPDLMRGMIGVGMRSGRLPEMLRLLAGHFQWMSALRGEILRIVIYPLVLVYAGVLIMLARDVAIASLKGMDPWSALLLALRFYAVPVLAGTALGWAAGEFSRGTVARRWISAGLLSLPIIGKLARKFAVGTFLDVFAATLESGLPITIGFESAVRAAPNIKIAKQLAPGLEFLRQGQTIGESLFHTKVFSSEAIAMITTGEMSAAAPALMRRVAGWYSEDIRNTARAIVRITSPIWLLVVAAGFFVNPLFLAGLAMVLVFAATSI
ncbi:MAG: type II secretion system F family protein [Candidatus Sumerlaeaceae bacterium]|nr:type II secretion system F family protein [Candidatus Sumerlaeaceae bacterium]